MLFRLEAAKKGATAKRMPAVKEQEETTAIAMKQESTASQAFGGTAYLTGSETPRQTDNHPMNEGGKHDFDEYVGYAGGEVTIDCEQMPGAGHEARDRQLPRLPPPVEPATGIYNILITRFSA